MSHTITSSLLFLSPSSSSASALRCRRHRPAPPQRPRHLNATSSALILGHYHSEAIVRHPAALLIPEQLTHIELS
ncbi:hypothetical protein DFH11DRAFT_1730015 [Phellopilus nigrolimitatus]|nr:hypothetical protein DFH11DRAFT_1730015 [Phellopilus nigrolimitatus]